MNALYFGVFMYGMSGLALVARYTIKQVSPLIWIGIWAGCFAVAACLTIWVTGAPDAIVIPLLGSVLMGCLTVIAMPCYTVFGLGLLMFNFSFSVGVLLCVNEIFRSVELSVLQELGLFLFLSAWVLLAIFFNSWKVVFEFPDVAIAFPKRIEALRAVRAPFPGTLPKVSVHVPCYQEPPALVIATIDALSNLQYDNYEVIVVDNNTTDASLWRPVEEHCKELGSKFSFFHVDPLAGAKAGAMNFALDKTSADVEIVAAIDADYCVDSDFLSALVPLFSDSQVAFVQASHEYREWRENAFLSSVYYYYMRFQKTIQPATNEFNSANLVGTMCLIRKAMLVEVGGWAEWCLTEDDELSVRLMGKGYVGHVLADTWGHGLIPETFEGVKKQLFRWMAGPVQEFWRHWRFYLGLSSGFHLTRAQRILRIMRLLEHVKLAFSFIPSLLFIGVAVYLILHELTVYPPTVFLLLIGAGVLMKYIKKWVEVRRFGGEGIKSHALHTLLNNALRVNAIRALVVPTFNVALPWIRTNKFAMKGSFFRAFTCVPAETLIAIFYFSWFAVLFSFADFQSFDFVALVTIFMFFEGVTYASSLGMAIFSEVKLTAT